MNDLPHRAIKRLHVAEPFELPVRDPRWPEFTHCQRLTIEFADDSINCIVNYINVENDDTGQVIAQGNYDPVKFTPKAELQDLATAIYQGREL